MELKFNSVEEVLEFAARMKPAPEPGVIRPGNIDPAAFVEHLGRIAASANGVLHRNAKFAAIKLYRAVFSTGLRESTEAVERAPVFW